MNESATARVSAAPAAVAERVSAFLRAVYLNFINLFLVLLRFTGGRRS